jgi:sugar O-acyltransferase (sialic acid O-acetyltransferase NeuD family)
MNDMRVPNLKKLLIFGAGGFGREVAWLAEQTWGDSVEKLFVVDRHEYLSEPVNGIPVELLERVSPSDGMHFVVAIGDPAARRRAVQSCELSQVSPALLVHPRSEISSWVEIGLGSVVCAGCIITTNIVIGRHVHINLDCTIGHDARIGDFCTLSPGVHVSGNVNLGQDVYVGTGATIINGRPGAPLEIGDGAVIAAGACVTRPVPPGAMVAGVPAIRKR